MPRAAKTLGAKITDIETDLGTITVEFESSLRAVVSTDLVPHNEEASLGPYTNKGVNLPTDVPTMAGIITCLPTPSWRLVAWLTG